MRILSLIFVLGVIGCSEKETVKEIPIITQPATPEETSPNPGTDTQGPGIPNKITERKITQSMDEVYSCSLYSHPEYVFARSNNFENYLMDAISDLNGTEELLHEDFLVSIKNLSSEIKIHFFNKSKKADGNYEVFGPQYIQKGLELQYIDPNNSENISKIVMNEAKDRNYLVKNYKVSDNGNYYSSDSNSASVTVNYKTIRATDSFDRTSTDHRSTVNIGFTKLNEQGFIVTDIDFKKNLFTFERKKTTRVRNFFSIKNCYSIK
jgi:hypothetical protein